MGYGEEHTLRINNFAAALAILLPCKAWLQALLHLAITSLVFSSQNLALVRFKGCPHSLEVIGPRGHQAFLEGEEYARRRQLRWL